MNKKKWMTSLELPCWKWIKDLTAKTGVPGSVIINELIAREMNDKSGKFIAMLAKTKMENELQRVSSKRAELEAKEQELERRLKSERTTVEA